MKEEDGAVPPTKRGQTDGTTYVGATVGIGGALLSLVPFFVRRFCFTNTTQATDEKAGGGRNKQATTLTQRKLCAHGEDGIGKCP